MHSMQLQKNRVKHTRTIDIPPTPAVRINHNGRFTEKSQKYLNWQSACRLLLKNAFKDAKIDPLSEIALEGIFYCELKRGANPDVNNLMKALGDALQDHTVGSANMTVEKGIIHNDNQVSEEHSYRVLLKKGEKGRIVVSITVL